MSEIVEIDIQEELKSLENTPASQVEMSSIPFTENQSVLTGRQKIVTSYISKSQMKDGMYGSIVLTPDNMHLAVNEAMKIHSKNATEIDYLMRYYKGEQEILKRTKEVRDDVNNKVVLNYASTFTRDIIGYTFGKPMQYITRKGDDTVKEEIKDISDYAEMANKSTSDQIKAANASICGISHRAIFKNKDEDDNDDESPFVYADLDSRRTFVALSNQLTEEPVFAVTFIDTQDASLNYRRIFTVYTKDEIYLYDTPTNDPIMNGGIGFGNTISKDNLVKGYPIPNPIGEIPIVECVNNHFRMGHWENALTVFNAINKVASDSVNDVEQFVNSILVAINAEFTEESMQQVRANKYAEIKAPQGLNADLKYISEQLDGGSVEQLRQYLEDSLRAIVGIPDRKTRGGGGGDTGDAVKLRDGWADMEVVARTTEMFNKESEKKELKIILKILKSLKKISKTSMINIDIKYPRNKTDNLSTKAQAMSTLLNMRIMAPEDVLEIGDVTTDIEEVVKRGEEYWQQKKEQEIEDQRAQLQMQKEFSTDAGANGGTQKGDVNATTKSNSGTNNGSKSNTNNSSKSNSSKSNSNTNKSK